MGFFSKKHDSRHMCFPIKTRFVLSAYTYLETLLLLTHYITISCYAKMLQILQPYPYPVMPELGGPGGPLAPPNIWQIS